MMDFIEEERVDLGRVVDQHHIDLTPEQLRNRIQPLIRRGFDVFQQLLGGEAVKLLQIEMINADF